MTASSERYLLCKQRRSLAGIGRERVQVHMKFDMRKPNVRVCQRGQSFMTGKLSHRSHSPFAMVLVNGNIGVVSRLPDGRLLSVIGFTIAGGKVVEMDILADPDRLSRLDLSAIEP
jgi:RNA polymerase sigma-70 factor (ECF subfamily)